MKKFLLITLSVLLFLNSSLEVYAAETTDDYGDELSESLGVDKLYSVLSDDVKTVLSELGIEEVNAQSLADVKFSDTLEVVSKIAQKQSLAVFSSLGIIIAVLLLYALVEGFLQSMTSQTMREVLSVVCTLCIACALVLPITDVIGSADEAIRVSAEFMLLFVPLMVAVLVSCGRVLSGSGYYSMLVFTAEGIAQLSSKVITPMLNVFLGVSLCTTIVPGLKLDSLTDLFSKTIKWLLSFSFTIFSALLTFRTLITTSIDNVSTRAVRFTMSSFIPVVGAALSEAYKTVQGSVMILKNGIGVFVIMAIGIVFLPIVLRLFLWSFALSLCRTISEILGVSVPGRLLKSLSTVLSVLLAVVLCVMALFIISTALIITVGGQTT